MKKRKLTFIISSMRSGGAERVMASLVNHFVEIGYDVTLILFTPASEKRFYEIDERVHVKALDCLSYNQSIFVYIKNIFYCLFVLRKALKKISPDCIISFLESVNIATLMANYGLKIPVIVSERIDPHFHRVFAVYRFARKVLYPLSTFIVMQTKGAAKYFSDHFLKKIKIIPNPIRALMDMKEHAHSSYYCFKIINVARLVDFKNQATLIKAFSLFLKEYPNSQLEIYGEGDRKEALEHLIKGLNLEENVFLKGNYRPIEEKLIDADIFVFPSFYEGFPNALLEAMSVGLPVIASNVTGNNDLVTHGENGLLFDPNNINELYKKMIEMTDFTLRGKLAENAKEVNDLYREEKIYKQWQDLIEEACAG
ncbi:MAG: GalNAc-alpha-(1-_4)-GalNAc-alpha-(1-_3)-diNAcBac-PP-undecaprenol alpha-1,4-N-acetyl-D-galactosaminyltransferase [Holosporales bacterium]